MEEKPDSRDSDGSWVLAGGEGLPIDTVGPEPQDSTSQGDEEPEEEEEEEGTQNVTSPRQPQRPESSRDTEECGDPKAGAAPVLDGSTVQDEEEEEEEEAGAEAKLGSCPDTPEAGPPMDQGTRDSTDGDDDDDGDDGDDGDDITTGLRRRLGHQPHPGHPPPVSVPHRGPQGAGDEDGPNVSRVLLGALALVAVGLLIVCGGFQEAADGPVDTAAPRDAGTGEQEPPPPAETPPPADGNDSQPPAQPQPGDPRGVQSVSVLLDRLAREDQELRLLQAELQAHKEQLRVLLQRGEGEAAAAENAQLRAALERESAALGRARAELAQLRAGGTPGSAPNLTEPGTGRPPSADPGAARGEGARGEGARGDGARGEGARGDGARGEGARGDGARGEGARGDGARGEGARGDGARGDGARGRGGALAALRQELAGLLERAGGPGGLEGLVEELRALEQRLARELEREAPGPWDQPFGAGRDGKRHQRHDGRDPPPRGRSQAPGPPKDDPWRPRERKGGKTWGKPARSPSEPPPPFHRARPPRGCSGVADCARQERLEPVRKERFLRLLRGFLGDLGLGQHFGGLAAQLEGAFGADGTFAHDRLRFADFVERVEGQLEALARRERGEEEEEAADGFEEYVRRHLGGGAAKDRGRKAGRLRAGGG